MLYGSLIATVLGVSMHDTTYTYNICVSVCTDAVSRWTRPAFNFRPAPCEVSTASARERFDSSVHAVFWLDPAHFHVYLLYSTPSCPAHWFYSMQCFFFLLFYKLLISLLHSTWLYFTTLLYMYRLTAFKASELRYFRLRCFCSPHLCVGFLVFVSVSHRRPPPVRPPSAQLCHAQSFTTQSFTHILTLSHTIFHNTNFHIHISHAHNFVTRNVSQSSHTFLPHTIFHNTTAAAFRCCSCGWLNPFFLHLVCRTCLYLYSWHISLISTLLCSNA